MGASGTVTLASLVAGRLRAAWAIGQRRSRRTNFAISEIVANFGWQAGGFLMCGNASFAGNRGYQDFSGFSKAE
jgi:hypothetical protein